MTGKFDWMWQDTGYVLKLFDKNKKAAREKYLEFVRKGILQGKRKDLVGGGLVRSFGGWEAVKANRMAGFLQTAN
jgi:hypothetical protein